MALTKADTRLGIARTFPVRSRRNGALYQVTLWKTGAWSCDCADWVNRRSKSSDHSERGGMEAGAHCKHVIKHFDLWLAELHVKGVSLAAVKRRVPKPVRAPKPAPESKKRAAPAADEEV